MSFFDFLCLLLPFRHPLIAEIVLSFQNFTRIILILIIIFPLVLVSLQKIWLMKSLLCSGLYHQNSLSSPHTLSSALSLQPLTSHHSSPELQSMNGVIHKTICGISVLIILAHIRGWQKWSGDTCVCVIAQTYWPEALNYHHLFPLICYFTSVMVTIDVVDKKSKMLPKLPQNSLFSITQEAFFQHQLSTAHSRKCFLRCVFLLRDCQLWNMPLCGAWIQYTKG